MKHLGLDAHLARAVKTFNRVDRPLFRSRMTFPTIDGETTIAAISYFYEPFLEAFDPQLREDLGVWYTPPEIVRYQVQRVHYLLKTELGRPRGLADPDVVVLDPCCGTGAYLLEVARCIASELKREGDESSLGLELARAFHERVMGFEILTAPFAIAQLQLYLLLDQLGSRPDEAHRVSIRGGGRGTTGQDDRFWRRPPPSSGPPHLAPRSSIWSFCWPSEHRPRRSRALLPTCSRRAVGRS